jgi:hypothetical protein
MIRFVNVPTATSNRVGIDYSQGVESRSTRPSLNVVEALCSNSRA